MVDDMSSNDDQCRASSNAGVGDVGLCCTDLGPETCEADCGERCIKNVATRTLGGSTEPHRVGFRGVFASATRSDPNSPSGTAEGAECDHRWLARDAFVGF